MVSLESELYRIHTRKLWEERLQESDSVFARLVYLSRLRDASGRYVDPVLVDMFPARTVHHMVLEAHRDTFREWLALNARAKTRDFRRYCQTICKTEAADVTAWRSLCRELVPSGVSIDELRFFYDNAKRLAQMISRELRQGG